MGFRGFENRREAGRALARALVEFAADDALVLGVPRGGVVVAAEVAGALRAPLDVLIARKIGAPMQPELAIGAVVSGEGGRLLDPASIRYLGVTEAYIEEETGRQLAEIRRRMACYRGDRPEPAVRGRTVIVVDDGVATGYTVKAALSGLRSQQPARLVLATPVAPPATCAELHAFADRVVCLETPDPFVAVGAWYADFTQTSDEEVAELLARFASPAAG
jgi:putative phosphoribosyl transferase